MTKLPQKGSLHEDYFNFVTSADTITFSQPQGLSAAASDTRYQGESS